MSVASEIEGKIDVLSEQIENIDKLQNSDYRKFAEYQQTLISDKKLLQKILPLLSCIPKHFQRIKALTDTNIVNMLHLQEEVGELSTEVMIEEGLIKKQSDEGVIGESVDVLVCTLAILANELDNLSEIDDYIDKKLTKWEDNKWPLKKN